MAHKRLRVFVLMEDAKACGYSNHTFPSVTQFEKNEAVIRMMEMFVIRTFLEQLQVCVHHRHREKEVSG